MNSHRRDSLLHGTTTSSNRLARNGRLLAWFGLAAVAIGALSGCARMKQYSIESWQGPLPMQDTKYVRVQQ